MGAVAFLREAPAGFRCQLGGWSWLQGIKGGALLR